MKYFIVGICLVVVLVVVLLYWLKRKRVIYKVQCMSKREKLRFVNRALGRFGFRYDVDEDVVVSDFYSWQREVGYSDFFDKKAVFFNIVMDAEPIYFCYDGKEYRLEFWKGQYGITTGAEAGIYILEDEEKRKYRCANDSEVLPMKLELYKKCLLFSREDCTWWLTGFEVGTFSRPSDLGLRVCVYFPNQGMQVAFIKGLLNAGYAMNKIKIWGCCVCFWVCCPKNYELNRGHLLLKCFVQVLNWCHCRLYKWFTRPFCKTLDRLAFLFLMMPRLYCFVLRFGIPKKKKKKGCRKTCKFEKKS